MNVADTFGRRRMRQEPTLPAVQPSPAPPPAVKEEEEDAENAQALAFVSGLRRDRKALNARVAELERELATTRGRLRDLEVKRSHELETLERYRRYAVTTRNYSQWFIDMATRMHTEGLEATEAEKADARREEQSKRVVEGVERELGKLAAAAGVPQAEP